MATQISYEKKIISCLNEFIPFLFRILDDSGGRALAEELHESALHHEPEASGQVEVHRQHDQEDRHPLVVRIVNNTWRKKNRLLFILRKKINLYNSKLIYIPSMSSCSFPEQAPLYSGGILKCAYIQQ